MSFGISGDTYGYYKNGQLVGFKSQADIDAAYQSGYTAGVAAGVTIHTGTYTITTNNTTIDLGAKHNIRYIVANIFIPASWAESSIVDIQTMLNNPSINVADYWSIGQQRTESSGGAHGSTSQTWVLTDFNSTTSGGTSYNAIIHTLSIYPTSQRMNEYNSNLNGWSGSNMRATFMPQIYNSLNSDFRSLIKTVNNISGAGNTSDTTQTTSDQIWLFSEREVFGVRSRSGQQEYNACKQFSYFTTASNKVKTGNVSSTGMWWLRSPGVSSSRDFCCVYSDGRSTSSDASNFVGIVAAAAI